MEDKNIFEIVINDNDYSIRINGDRNFLWTSAARAQAMLNDLLKHLQSQAEQVAGNDDAIYN